MAFGRHIIQLIRAEVPRPPQPCESLGYVNLTCHGHRDSLGKELYLVLFPSTEERSLVKFLIMN